MMFERFSREARAAVTGAREVAEECGSSSIDTRHILAALVESEGGASLAMRANDVDPAAFVQRIRAEVNSSGLDATALRSLGIDLDAVRKRADAVFGEGVFDRTGRRRLHLRFAPEAKRALELALREAIRLQLNEISGGVLLLGILRGDCTGRALLVREGVDVAALRRTVEESLRRSA